MPEIKIEDHLKRLHGPTLRALIENDAVSVDVKKEAARVLLRQGRVEASDPSLAGVVELVRAEDESLPGPVEPRAILPAAGVNTEPLSAALARFDSFQLARAACDNPKFVEALEALGFVSEAAHSIANMALVDKTVEAESLRVALQDRDAENDRLREQLQKALSHA